MNETQRRAYKDYKKRTACSRKIYGWIVFLIAFPIIYLILSYA